MIGATSRCGRRSKPAGAPPRSLVGAPAGAGQCSLAEGRQMHACRSFRHAHWIGRLGFTKDDPRRATGYANLAFIARLLGSEAKAERHYAAASPFGRRRRRRWRHVRSNHGRAVPCFICAWEVRHWDTYRNNMKRRLGKFIQETGGALHALSQRNLVPHRLFSRWRGEKQRSSMTRESLLAACLLVATDLD